MTQGFDPYRKWLGIPPKDCPPHHYRLLGIEILESDPDVISHAADARMAHIRTFQSGRYSEQSQKILNEIAAAKVCLLNPERKVEYDQQLRQRLTGGPGIAAVAVAVAAPIPAAVAVPAGGDGQPTPSAAPQPAPLTVRSGATSAAAILARRRRTWQAPAFLAVLGAGVIVLGAVLAMAPRDSQSRDQADASKAQGASASNIPNPTPAKSTEGKAKTEKPAPKPPEKASEKGSTPKPQTPEPPEKPQPDPAPPERPLEKEKPAGEKPADPAGEPEPGEKPEPGEMPGPPGPKEKPGGLPTELPSQPDTKPVAKAAVPDRAVQAAKERQVRELFKEDFSKAGSADGRAALADKLIRQGHDTGDDPEARFVLFRLAAELAALAGDATALGDATARLGELYEVRPVEVKATALEAAASAVADEDAVRKLVETIRDVVDEAMAADAYEVADRLVKAAVGPARRTKDATLIREVVALRGEVDRLTQRFAQVQKDLKRLEDDPSDAAANLAVGRWYALGVGRWDKALPYLAKGSDSAMAEAARRDLADPSEANARLETGNQWWDLGEKHQAEDRLALQGRAVHWYELAVADLSGLTKTQAEKRIEAYAAATAGKDSAKKKGEYALSFDGQKSYVLVPNMRYDGSQPLTVEVILTPASVDKSCAVVGNINSAGGWGMGLFDLRPAGVQNRHWAFFFRAQSRRGIPPATGSDNAAAANQRVVLAGVCDNGEIRCYVDGQKQYLTGRLRGPHIPGPPVVMIGAAPAPNGTPQEFFHGTVEQVRLSLAARYTDNYTPPKRLEKDKLTELLFNFDEGEGTVLRDASGNRHNGKIVGAKWVKRAP